MRDKVKRQRPQTTTSEQKGEPKQIPTEVLLLTSLTSYRCPFKDHFALRPQKRGGLLGTGRTGGRGYGGGGEGDYIYLSLHCHHPNDSCIKMGGDESHFDVSVGSDGQSHKTESTNHNLFEEKGQPKRYRSEVLPLTSLTPYR